MIRIIPASNMDNVANNDEIKNNDMLESESETSPEDVIETIAEFMDLLRLMEAKKQDNPAMSLAEIAMMMMGGNLAAGGLGGATQTGTQAPAGGAE